MSRHITTVPACSSGTLTNVLLHKNAMPQTQDMAPETVTVYIQTQGRPVVVLSIDVCSHHYFSFMKVLHDAGSVRSCIIILENETWNHCSNTKRDRPSRWLFNKEMVTQMHSQTRWPSTAIDPISVTFFRAPNLFKLICGSDMDMIHNKLMFAYFYNPIFQTLLDITFDIFF